MKIVAVEMLTTVSGKGWYAPAGRYECSASRAKMLIRRGYARKIDT